jgi:DNA-binding FadR family transcriptional regulator
MGSRPERPDDEHRPRLRQPRLAELVAARVRDDIVAGRLRDGDRLARQDQFALELGVGISVLREALRILESEGLVVVHRGKIGGATVRQPSPAALVVPLATLLRTAGVAADDATATLALLDGACAARAALLPGRQHVGATVRRASDDPERFHRALAEACGLETLRVLVIALGRLPADGARRACELPGASLSREHEQAAAAISEGDPAGAFLGASHLRANPGGP